MLRTLRQVLADKKYSMMFAAALTIGVAQTYQFFWSPLRPFVTAGLDFKSGVIGGVFSVFVTLQAVSQFLAGVIRDRYGPTGPLVIAAICLATGYSILAFVDSLVAVYISYTLGGIGAGTAYAVAINTPVKWFETRQGLATGIVGMSSSGMSFLLVPLLRWGVLRQAPLTLLSCGITCGIVVLAAAIFIQDPTNGEENTERTDPEPGDSVDWHTVIRTRQFWYLYLVFFIANAVGLLLIGNIVSLTQSMGFTTAVATISASSIALFDSIGIGVGGALSDRIGRERTLSLTLGLCSFSMLGSLFTARENVAFVYVGCLAAAVFFTSSVFSTCPTLMRRYYGGKYTSQNYALLYSAKVWGGIAAGTVAGVVSVSYGWDGTIVAGAILAGVGSLAVRQLSEPTFG